MARKILLADDSVTAQNMGRKILADAGYEVITVNNGSAALKKIAETKPDLIVLDVYMPGYSGLEVCQRLKDSNDTARIPILLTVGKLEPFKPEEARRVRAEGFIVKPFEASELLSALTKLEDKIVPRADSSKPGRFARAIATVEEGRYDKTVSIDEDSGWKNRIAFPKKKKEKAPENGDDPAIYNAVNRDLKTVIENNPVREAPAPVQPSAQPVAQQQQAHVDLGALVAHGLPKDVTPEEIAALAAAAAQVQGISGDRSSEAVSSTVPNLPETRLEEESRPEIASSQTEEARRGEIKSEASVAKFADTPIAQTDESPVVAPLEANTEEAAKIEAKQTIEPAASSEKRPSEVMATFASENLQQNEMPEPELKAAELPREEPISAGGETSVIASFATAETEPGSVSHGSMDRTPLTSEHELVQSAGDGTPVASRWTAVAVALAPEEASVALEEEMRKAQASPQAPPVGIEALPVDERPVRADEALVTEAPPVAPETEAPAAFIPSSTEPETEEPPAAVGSATPSVREFEAVAPREPEPSPVVAEAAVEWASPAASIVGECETSAAIPAAAETATDANLAGSTPGSLTDPAPELASSPTISEAAASQELTPVPPEAMAASPEREIPAHTQPLETAGSAGTSLEQVPESPLSQESGESAAVAAGEELSGGFSDPAKKESEIAANTAAAWASWRRIRETDGRDEAAMAVAAGAEKAPEEASDDAEVSPEIANIVDTVLADLRPKIVEEISRKMGKKKK